MAWRTVVISNPARLKIENDQLLMVLVGEKKKKENPKYAKQLSFF